MKNEFSREWYERFLAPIPEQSTAAEVALLERQLPAAEFPRLLDVCCGPGRHAHMLAARGYRVLGVDANAEAVARAQQDALPGASYRVLDMRDLDSLGERFDGVTNLWHSFGYFDDGTNEGVLRAMGRRLRPGGRVVIDVYNREHIATLPLVETYERRRRGHSAAPGRGCATRWSSVCARRRRRVRMASLLARGVHRARGRRGPARAARVRLVPTSHSLRAPSTRACSSCSNPRRILPSSSPAPAG